MKCALQSWSLNILHYGERFCFPHLFSLCKCCLNTAEPPPPQQLPPPKPTTIQPPASTMPPVQTKLLCFPFDPPNATSRIFQTLQCIQSHSRWCFLMMSFYMRQHFVVYAALSKKKNQTCNYANMYAFIIIKFYCKWLMHINLIL